VAQVYNQERPHDSLGRVPPLTFLPRPSSAGKSTFELSTGRGSLRDHNESQTPFMRGSLSCASGTQPAKTD
jgi:hypothetical protein